MKSSYLSAGICLLAIFACLLVTAGPAQAATYTWTQTTEGPSTFNWNDPTNWASTPGDFPNGVDAVVIIPHFTVNKNEYNNNETIDLNVPLTLGTLSVVNSNPAYGDAHGSEYLITANGGSLTFQVSSGQAELDEYLDVAYGSGSWNIAAPITLASDTVVNTKGVVPGSISMYNGNGGISEGIIFSQALSGSGALIKTGPSGLWISSTNNSYTGNVDVQQGYLLISAASSLGNSPDSLTLGSVGEIGHLIINANTTMTEPITLTGAGGSISPIGTVSMSSIIGGSGTFIVDHSNGASMTFTEASANTYVGQAFVLTPNVNVTSAATVFTGNLAIGYGGGVSLGFANNVGGTITVTSPLPFAVNGVQGVNQLTAYGLMSAVGVKSDFFPALTSDSYGIIYMDQTSGSTGTNFNAAVAVGAAQVGNGYMAYGSYLGNVAFTGTSLQPDLDNVYRFDTYNYLRLDASGTVGALNDVNGNPCSVDVANKQNTNTEYVRTYDTNAYTGTTTVEPNAVFSGFTRNTDTSLIGPFGAAAGAVTLNGGYLELIGGDAAAQTVAKGDTTIHGPAGIWVSNAYMTINSIQRPDYGTLGVFGETSNGTVLGGIDRLYVTSNANGYLTPTNGMVAPWMVGYYGYSFLTYGANGFAPAAFTQTGAATGGGAFTSGATDIVNLPSGGTIATGGQTAWAVRVGGSSSTTTYSLNSNAPGDILTIGSGGLILDSSNGVNGGTVIHTANINFGSSASPVEGVIYIGPSGGTQYHQLSGALQSWGGLTVSSYSATNHNTRLFIPNANPGLVGQITIDDADVFVGNSTSLGPVTNPIYLNTPPGSGGNAPSGALGAMANITIGNTITLGPLGGQLSTDQSSFSVSGQITGAGTLYVEGFHDAGISLTNTSTTTPNNWTGGTWIFGTNLYLNYGAALGSGSVVIGGNGSDGGSHLHLNNNGSGTVTVPGRIILEDTFYDYAAGLYLENNGTFSVGSIEGNGAIGIDNQGTLSVGSDNLSTDFYGSLRDHAQTSGAGNFVKTGTGTLTLWGDTILSGTVTVNGGGTLAINGSLNGAPLTAIPVSVSVTGAGSTLAGTGTINTAALSATSSGAVNMTNATINATTFSLNTSSTANLNGCTVTGTTMTLGPPASGAFWVTFTGNGNTINETNMYLYAGNTTPTGGTTTTFTGNNNIINSALTVGNTKAAASVPCTFSGTGNIINSLASYTNIVNGTISGSNTINTLGLCVNTANYALCTLSGTNTINGPTFLSSNGTTNYTGSTNAAVSGSNTFNGPVTMYGGSFSGNNTVNGAFTTTAASAAVVAPHVGTAASTLTINGAVTLDHSTALNFNLGAPGTTGSNVNDLINITGALSLDGTLNVNNLSGFGVGVYTLIDYTGALTGAGLTKGTMPTVGNYKYTIDTTVANEINLDVATAYPSGDTNHDGVVNSLDVDAIYQNLTVAPASYSGTWPRALQPYQAQYDVNGDSVVSTADVTYELNKYFLTSYGDADMNKATDFQDFQVLLNHWQATGSGVGWATADFNGDGVVDFLDFQILLNYWNPGGWNIAPSQVPEPASLSLLALGALALLRRKK